MSQAPVSQRDTQTMGDWLTMTRLKVDTKIRTATDDKSKMLERALLYRHAPARGARIISDYDCMLKRAASRRSPTPERRKFNEAARTDQGNSFFPAILGESLPAADWALS